MNFDKFYIYHSLKKQAIELKGYILGLGEIDETGFEYYDSTELGKLTHDFSEDDYSKNPQLEELLSLNRSFCDLSQKIVQQKKDGRIFDTMGNHNKLLKILQSIDKILNN